MAGLSSSNAVANRNSGPVVDVYVSQRRDIASARRFFTAAQAVHGGPCEVITDRAPALANVIEDLVPAALHNTGQYENNRIEYDHGRLKARLRPMRGLKTHRTAAVVIRGHALIQNLRRGHDELAVDSAQPFPAGHRIQRTQSHHLTGTRHRVPPRHSPGTNNATERLRHEQNRLRHLHVAGGGSILGGLELRTGTPPPNEQGLCSESRRCARQHI